MQGDEQVVAHSGPGGSADRSHHVAPCQRNTVKPRISPRGNWSVPQSLSGHQWNAHRYRDDSSQIIPATTATASIHRRVVIGQRQTGIKATAAYSTEQTMPKSLKQRSSSACVVRLAYTTAGTGILHGWSAPNARNSGTAPDVTTAATIIQRRVVIRGRCIRGLRTRHANRFEMDAPFIPRSTRRRQTHCRRVERRYYGPKRDRRRCIPIQPHRRVGRRCFPIEFDLQWNAGR